MKKLFTSLLILLGLSYAQEMTESPAESNFFVRGIQNEVDTWNKHYRDTPVEEQASMPTFLENIKVFYKKELYEYAATPRTDAEPIHLIQSLEPGIETVFQHLSNYYALLEQYGQTCFGITPDTAEDDIPAGYEDYISTIQDECAYLAMLILKHCVWGGGDTALIGTDRHFSRVFEWAKEHLYSMPHLPEPPLNPATARVSDKLGENDMTQSAINFSLLEPEKLAMHQVFSYTNLLANMHMYGKICPLLELSLYLPEEQEEICNFERSASLIIAQQDEWSRLVNFCFSEFFMPESLGIYGTGSGVLTSELVNRQMALLNYLSGDLFYEKPKSEEPHTAGAADEAAACDTALLDESSTGSVVKPAYILPPLFILVALLVSCLLTPGIPKGK